jgi:hypothetical protein
LSRKKDNPSNLVVDVLTANEWRPFKPSIETPGFLLFVYALFSCQLRYMRTNCAERNIVLSSTPGELELVAGEFWYVRSVFVRFNSVLKSGLPTADDIDYIKERMKHCPVSTNLSEQVGMRHDISFE